MIRYKIPITQLKQSTNKIYAGVHWAKRKEFKDSVLDYANGFCRPTQKVESYPVEVRYQFFFRKKPLDTLNCAYIAKCFEDALRTLGTLQDDDVEFVARAIIEVAAPGTALAAQMAFAQGPEADAKNDDWLEITINPI
jgi:hypothetical protein